MAKKVHRYYIKETGSWSVWLVDEATGTLVIFGDRGTWSHTWGRAGRSGRGKKDFRVELLRFCANYLENKLSVGCARTYDEEATQKKLEQHLGSLEFEDTPYQVTDKKCLALLERVADRPGALRGCVKALRLARRSSGGQIDLETLQTAVQSLGVEL